MITIRDAAGNEATLSSDADPGSLFVRHMQSVDGGPRSSLDFLGKPGMFKATITDDWSPPPRWDIELLPAAPLGYGPGGNAHQRRRWRRWKARNAHVLHGMTPRMGEVTGETLTVTFSDEAPSPAPVPT